MRCFAFDEFGPLSIRPTGGSAWAPAHRPQRQPANYNKTHGVRQFHGCYSVGEDVLWGVVRRQKSAANTLPALRSIRARRRDGAKIYVILDNLSAHKGPTIREWAANNNVELCYTPTYSSWANPIEAHFGPLREFVLRQSPIGGGGTRRPFLLAPYESRLQSQTQKEDPAAQVAVRGPGRLQMHGPLALARSGPQKIASAPGRAVNRTGRL